MKNIIWISFFLISLIGYGQTSKTLTPEQYLQLQEKTRSYFNANIDSALFYANKIEQSSNLIHKAFAKGVKGYMYAKKGDFNKADANYKEALSFIQKAPKSKFRTQNESYIYNYGGIICRKKEQYASALDNYFIAKRLASEVNDLVQIVKINNNIALVNADVKNYQNAIKITRESEKVLMQNKSLYSSEEQVQNLSNTYLNLGSYYERYYFQKKSVSIKLDSAFYYYQKALNYSKNIEENKLKALMNLGNLYLEKKDYKNTELAYSNVIFQAKENDFPKEIYTGNYNLGYSYFVQKKYAKAIVYFQKVDSTYKLGGFQNYEYIYSNYYQAKIYESYQENEKALLHSELYLENFEKDETKNNESAFGVNVRLENQDLVHEMRLLKKKNQTYVLLKKSIYALVGIAVVILIFMLYKTNRNRKLAEQKVAKIIEEFALNKQKTLDDSPVVVSNNEDEMGETLMNETVQNINLEKEFQILEKLKSLEERYYYLRPEFSQQEVAKKIKTNTTYLSYIVNKNYGKSFSAYYNELRINYAINEIITNKKYREYTTQAIAESVGFKNADSFASSFKKKTGVTPYQFINEIKKKSM